MKGLIVLNPYGLPNNSSYQAERLTEEFNKLGVPCEICKDGYSRARVNENGFITALSGFKFVIYLDKDKYLSDIIARSGIKMFNSHNSIRVCDDKGETYIALCDKGLNVPETVFAPLCYDDAFPYPKGFLEYVEKTLGYPIIVKESYGSMGKGVRLAADGKELRAISDKVKKVPHLYQKYLGKKKGFDIRVTVVGQKAVCAMARVNDNDFRSNIALGGKGYAIDIFSDEYAGYKAAAEKCAEVLGLDYCGVDLLVGDDGRPFVCEVNSNAFFKETEKVTGVNVAKIYAEYVLKVLK